MVTFFAEHANAEEIKIEATWELNKFMVVSYFQSLVRAMAFIIVKSKKSLNATFFITTHDAIKQT
jgi:hypothetical protein